MLFSHVFTPFHIIFTFWGPGPGPGPQSGGGAWAHRRAGGSWPWASCQTRPRQEERRWDALQGKYSPDITMIWTPNFARPLEIKLNLHQLSTFAACDLKWTAASANWPSGLQFQTRCCEFDDASEAGRPPTGSSKMLECAGKYQYMLACARLWQHVLAYTSICYMLVKIVRMERLES